ncbi:MAG: dicarboxylate/amino acid:cation symporter [Marinifilaceae bacterium]
MKRLKLGLLPKIIIAIIAGIGCGLIFPEWTIRIFVTFNSIFGNYLGFIIPLLILGLVAPGIADLGKGAGRLLVITALIAYGFTISTGFMTYFSCDWIYPSLLKSVPNIDAVEDVSRTFAPYFTVEMPPIMGVMSALVAAFAIGLGAAFIKGQTLKNGLNDFKDIIYRLITYSIIPLLPIYIFGIFMNIAASGQVAGVVDIFSKIIGLIFVMTIVLLIIQFSIAGIVAKKNPFKLFKRMIPAYMTALGTQSSAATIPVTLQQTIKNDVDEELADFVIPLCATIHLSGSTMKIVACAMAIMLMSGGTASFGLMAGFILMLGITMVAAPGVPGGAIMAALGLLETMLGFDATAQGLMVALYIAMDSFGTATNVTGDGAIAVIVDRIYKK